MERVSQLIEKYIKKYNLTDFQLSENTCNYIDNNFRRIEVKKKKLISEEEKKEKYLYFIEKGILRYWTQDIHYQEITFWFSFSGEFANSYYSFCKEEKSDFNIEALTDCVIWRADKKFILEMYNSSLEINKLARIVMEDIFTRKIKHEIELLKYTLEERYKLLATRDCNLLKEIPLKYIASYIGGTPQSISRIRRKLFT